MMTTRIAIVGCGRIAESHCEALAGLRGVFTLAACVDRDTARARAFARRWAAERVFGSVEEVVSSGACEAAIVCLPHASLAGTARYLLDNGIHVLLEKPCGLNAGQYEDAMAVATAKHAWLLPAYVRRFMGPYVRAHAMIAESRSGNVYGYLRNHVGHLEEVATPWWLSADTAGGFHVPIFASHSIDSAIWFAGKPPVSVYATYVCTGHLGIEGETDGTIALDFGDAGFASITFARTSEGPSVDIERLLCGEAAYDVSNTHLLRNGEAVPFAEANPFAAQLSHFHGCIRGRPDCLITPRAGLDVLRVMDAASRSNREGKSIALSAPGESRNGPTCVDTADPREDASHAEDR